MPLVGTEAKLLFGYIFLLPNFVDYKSNSYPTNIEILKYATQPMKDEHNHLPYPFLTDPNLRHK